MSAGCLETSLNRVRIHVRAIASCAVREDAEKKREQKLTPGRRSWGEHRSHRRERGRW